MASKSSAVILKNSNADPATLPSVICVMASHGQRTGDVVEIRHSQTCRDPVLQRVDDQILIQHTPGTNVH